MNGPPRSADCRGGLFRYIEWGYSQITIKSSYNNETIIIDCVGLGSAGADGV